MASGEDGGYVAAGNITVAVFVSGAVVRVADILIVLDGVVMLNHRVLRLHYVQLGEVGAHPLVTLFVEVSGQPYCADEGTGVSGVAGGIDAAHRHELVEPCAVILAVYPGYTDPVCVGAS